LEDSTKNLCIIFHGSSHLGSIEEYVPRLLEDVLFSRLGNGCLWLILMIVIVVCITKLFSDKFYIWSHIKHSFHKLKGEKNDE